MNKEDFDEAMAEELKKWDKLGVIAGNYRPAEGLLGVIFRFETLHKLLVEKGIITDEEADELYREVALSGLKKVREEAIEPAVEAAKRQAILQRIHSPTMRIPKNEN
jgi:hypothetical protein